MITQALLLALLVIIVVIAFHLSRQSEQQHRELLQIIDALAEMIGEAIDKNERN